ncbi:META domain-containing protein [Pelagibacterium xiamenense]|uniref:META domain-containing protein n=1 Tax=Pelagibacterium xiamenense TaxID=2901140 RepID=UPI001E351879|nr:META domain-containing protein [Pelagibacterium xiamenense]MCD7058719.1 META domain-containing protein [Pelagibacterium xiamenense]
MKAIAIFGMAGIAAALFAGVALSRSADIHPLVGTHWSLSSLGGAQTPEGATATLNFGEENDIGGNGGCNVFGGSVTFKGEAGLDISEVFSTMMACEPPKMEQERAFFDALEAAAGFSLEGDTLTLLDDGDETLAVLVPASD